MSIPLARKVANVDVADSGDTTIIGDGDAVLVKGAAADERGFGLERDLALLVEEGDDALDLGAAVLPILLKGYWKQGAVSLLVLAVLLKVLRRR